MPQPQTSAPWFGADEALLLVALALLTGGLWALVGPAALIAPGLCLTWISMPTRTAFVLRPARPNNRKEQR